jgi:geranylgeranyl diphosphate synthase type II
MGAISGKADGHNARLLYEFGKNIGLAFQLQDDLLDVFSDSVVFGKVCGNDIVSNKKTLLIIEALSRAGKAEKEVLNYWLEKKEFDRNEKIESIRKIYLSLGIDLIARQRIESYHQQALKCLHEVSVSTDRKEMLINFSNLLMKRKK